MSNITPNQRSQLLHDMHTFCVNPHTREIFLHSYTDTDEEECIDYKMATMFAKNMTYLHNQNDKPIFIHMHSPGGDWNDGMAIYDTIKHSKCHVTVLAYAHASSMSSIILQAADLRLLLPNTEILIHYGDISLDTTSLAATSYLDLHVKNNKTMLNIYTSRCIDGNFCKLNNKTEVQIKQFIHKRMTSKQDWYLTAVQSIEYGFADYIVGCDKYPNIISCVT